MGITRRTFVKRSGQAAAGAGAVWLAGSTVGPAAQALAASRGSAGTAHITVTEATNASAALSPDGRTIAFDLLNLLWTVPAVRRLV
ncbi:hypothetical protein OG369_41675 [Streptomyces sp. NBC_01221]|uniref:hypothetical protein n=1 Tax=Streptomyces sp. NBC_01221 TaxID=2903782 RepID=UPI0022579C89|nr:hypothetical protein [Streptomyces sp. NBC_01221]MCX4792312.1 hypothetical protein [Streptomyces sp. NBC_01221]